MCIGCNTTPPPSGDFGCTFILAMFLAHMHPSLVALHVAVLCPVHAAIWNALARHEEEIKAGKARISPYAATAPAPAPASGEKPS